VPLQPEFIEYPNAQFLMIGEAQDSLGKAASAQGGKQAHEIEPGEELEKMEHENEGRVHALEGKILESSSTVTLHRLTGISARRHDHFPRSWLGREEICSLADDLGR
jgi:hypothetical protein